MDPIIHKILIWSNKGQSESHYNFFFEQCSIYIEKFKSKLRKTNIISDRFGKIKKFITFFFQERLSTIFLLTFLRRCRADNVGNVFSRRIKFLIKLYTDRCVIWYYARSSFNKVSLLVK